MRITIFSRYFELTLTNGSIANIYSQFSLQDPHVDRNMEQASRCKDIKSMVFKRKISGEYWKVMLMHHVSAFVYFKQGNFSSSCDAQLLVFRELKKLLEETEREEKPLAWMNNTVRVVVSELRQVAVAADRQLQEAGQAVKHCAHVAQTLRGNIALPAFHHCYLSIAVAVMKIYFRLQSSQKNCQAVMAQVQRKGGDESVSTAAASSSASFSKSDQAAYAYYAGRYYILSGEYFLARERLMVALALAPRNFGNKRRILNYLMLLNIFCFRFPTQTLRQRYDIDDGTLWGEVIGVVKSGNVLGYQQWVGRHEEFLARRGLYVLALEGQSRVMYRLFARTFMLMREGEKQNYLYLKHLLVALQLATSGREVTQQEADGIFSHMIDKKWVQAYLTKQRGKEGNIAVFHKSSPFLFSNWHST